MCRACKSSANFLDFQGDQGSDFSNQDANASDLTDETISLAEPGKGKTYLD
jgi:hypothetical protein